VLLNAAIAKPDDSAIALDLLAQRPNAINGLTRQQQKLEATAILAAVFGLHAIPQRAAMLA
jgi:hypothetical protein